MLVGVTLARGALRAAASFTVAERPHGSRPSVGGVDTVNNYLRKENTYLSF